MAEVTGYRIVALQTRIADVLNQTSDASTLPEAEQAKLLADSCEQACGLLGDWLHSTSDRLRPERDVPIKDLLPARERFEEFLGVTLRDALAQADRYGLKVDVEQIEQARKAIATTVRKKPRTKSEPLFQNAINGVTALKRNVCDLASDLQSQVQDAAARTQDAAARAQDATAKAQDATAKAQDAAAKAQDAAARVPGAAAKAQGSGLRRSARWVLKQVGVLLPALVIGMAGVGPSQVSHNFAEWGHEAVKVVAVHHVAHITEPSMRVILSQQGPALH